MRDYFFERVRPIVEQALRDGNHDDWPLVTLNLDLKSEEPEHLAAIWQLLAEYKDWITSAPKGADVVSLVRHAHLNRLWIRFYTLDGATKSELSSHGWFRSYNFGSKEAVNTRWAAAVKAGVDYVASDQYEELGRYLKSQR